MEEMRQKQARDFSSDVAVICCIELDAASVLPFFAF